MCGEDVVPTSQTLPLLWKQTPSRPWRSNLPNKFHHESFFVNSLHDSKVALHVAVCSFSGILEYTSANFSEIELPVDREFFLLIVPVSILFACDRSRLSNEPGSTPNFHQATPREFAGGSLALI